jgi:hypothetical protein
MPIELGKDTGGVAHALESTEAFRGNVRASVVNINGKGGLGRLQWGGVRALTVCAAVVNEEPLIHLVGGFSQVTRENDFHTIVFPVLPVEDDLAEFADLVCGHD